MSYLEQILAQNAQRGQRMGKRKASIQDLLTAVQAPPAQAATPKTGGAGPHSKGDGHNHGSGGQTVGEANELWRRLQNMLKDSPGGITPGSRSRSYEEQVKLYNNYKAGRGPQAAKPGTSKHGNGRANDLKYANDAARQWALANAGKYGLAMPIYNPNLPRHLDESWHVELKR